MKKLLFIILTILLSISLFSCTKKTELSEKNISDYVKIDISFDKVTSEEKKILSSTTYDLYSSVTVKISPKDDYVFSNTSISYELNTNGKWKKVRTSDKISLDELYGKYLAAGTIQLDKNGYGEQTIDIRCNHTSKTYKPSNNKWSTEITSAKGDVSASSRSSGITSPQNDYYIVNKTSNKFHLPSCTSLPSSSNSYKVSVDDINKSAYSDLSPCGICKPLDNTSSDIKSTLSLAEIFALAIVAFYVVMIIVLKVSANKTTIENIESSPLFNYKLLSKLISASFWLPNIISLSFVYSIAPLWISIICAVLYLLFNRHFGTFFDAIILIIAIIYYLFFEPVISILALILLIAGMAYTIISGIIILNNPIVTLAVRMSKMKIENSESINID